MPLRDEALERDAERSLEPHYAERRAVVFQHLFIRVMRRVIGRYRVNRAVAHRFDQRGAVFFRAQRRVHLGVGVESYDRLIGERQMMRRDFASHPNPARFARRTISTAPAVEMCAM